MDVELVVKKIQGESGFFGQSQQEEVAVVFDKERTQTLFSEGERIRVLGARWEKGELRLMQATEVFYC